MEMEDGKISLLVKIIMRIMKMKMIVKKIILVNGWWTGEYAQVLWKWRQWWRRLYWLMVDEAEKTHRSATSREVFKASHHFYPLGLVMIMMMKILMITMERESSWKQLHICAFAYYTIELQHLHFNNFSSHCTSHCVALHNVHIFSTPVAQTKASTHVGAQPTSLDALLLFLKKDTWLLGPSSTSVK